MRIGAQGIDAVLGLLAEAAVFRRADRVYCGKSRIAHFVREERLICGRHGVEAVWQVAGHAMVPGQLYAAVGEGDPRSASFVDFWKFGAGDSVAKGRTFLVTGHALVDHQPAMTARREPRIVAQTTQLSHKLTSKTAVY